mmetsp:Transcript_45832/g.55624  ORF Transcript_45832/g.55624 Transcript_45832/m.55624 type:complete len:197 (-) Transcript_45832:410-1000(-)
MSKLKDDVNGKSVKYKVLTDNTRKLELSAVVTSGAKDELKAEKEALIKASQKAEKKIIDLSKKLEEQQKQMEMLNCEVHSKSVDGNALLKKLDIINRENDELKAENLAFTEASQNAEERVMELSTKLEEQQKKIDRLSNELESKSVENIALVKKIEMLDNQVDALKIVQEKNEYLQAGCKQLHTKCNVLKRNLSKK